ncbi:MAG: hypothetical protein IT365_21605 [Candidatus Hydrogenedentes bacterium]|nr:hypothetical protein [Candidatus Hydrogenedentota bacterium]
MRRDVQPILADRLFILIVAISAGLSATAMAQSIGTDFANPPIECRPRTFWFWPGNAVTREEITWELRQMHEQGLGGVLLNSAFGPLYEKGSIPFLSDEHLAMVRHAVLTARDLDMKVTLNFSGGWVFGGFWVPPDERSQSLVPASLELTGPQAFSGELPKFVKASDHRGEIQVADIPDVDKLVAVVAGKVVEGMIEADSLVDLTARVKGTTLVWQAPAGTWRIMAFWLKPTGQRTIAKDFGQDHWCVDHFNRTAMKHYCDFIGGKFYQAVGDEFGKTVEALHCDSFEMASLPNGFYWSDGLMAEFSQYKGYDIAKYLPALWWPVGDISPKITYDVNDFLHHAGMEIFVETFVNWCHEHHVKASMEPYGFTTDTLENTGAVDLPFMEVTPGEKDAVPWFDTRIGPRRYVASGANQYGRNVVGVEAYTFAHWELYRATLEELKIASDGFLCAGANQFYNHLYCYTPEREIAPSRALPWEVVLNHTNVWWQHYRLLADYLARCCYLLRLGHPQKDIAIYSPLANQWTLDVKNARKWTREFYWGDLGKLIAANGYDFDLINDDVLQHHADLGSGRIRAGGMSYRVLILPNIQAIPLATLQKVQQFVQDGGVVIALERVPDSATGLTDCATNDAQVRTIVSEMFAAPAGDNGTGPRDYGKGRTHCIKLVINRQDILDARSSMLDPFVNSLREHVTPDLGIDFAQEGLRENNGLTFVHRVLDDTDIYFVSNIQQVASTIPLTFRVQGKVPWRWNPYTGAIARHWQYRTVEDGIELPLKLAPYESTFVLFESGEESPRVEQSNFTQIADITQDAVQALCSDNGEHFVVMSAGGGSKTCSATVRGIPAPLRIDCAWQMSLEGHGLDKVERTLTQLISWTEDPATKHFSGTGRYETSFTLPKEYLASGLELLLDLGRVGNVAVVELNGTKIGTTWMRGQTLDITKSARRGQNRLVVRVTNTDINRASSLTEPVPVPEDLVPHYGSGTTPFTEHFRGPAGFKPLPASGLLGPVHIVAMKKVGIPIR